jgi:2-keto-4-pentenoate hydratase
LWSPRRWWRPRSYRPQQGSRPRMALDPRLLADLASQLADARAGHMTCELQVALHQRLDEADAYAIQQALLEAELARGERPVGLKVGATNEIARQRLGCREPFFGWLFESGRMVPGGTVDVSRLIRPRIECEVAFGLARDLLGPGIRREDALAAAAWAAAAFEIIDCRVAGVAPTVYEIIADNSSSALFVVSDLRVDPASVDLSRLTVAMTRNGEPFAVGSTAPVMEGDPAASVAWLGNRLTEVALTAGGHIHGLTAGMVVLTGAMVPAQAVSSGEVFEADFGPLGTLQVSFSR